MTAPQILALAKTIVALGKPPRNRLLRRGTFEVPAGGSVPVAVEGDYLYVHSVYSPTTGGNASGFKIRFDSGEPLELVSNNEGRELPFDFRQVFLVNTDASYRIIVDISIGYGRIQNDVGDLVTATGARLVAATSGAEARPADTIAYAVGDRVTNATFSFSPNLTRTIPNTGRIVRAQLVKSTVTTANASFRLYLKPDAPYPVETDNQPIVFSSSMLSGVSAVIEFPAFVAEGASTAAYCDISGLDIPIIQGSSMRGVLVATGAYAPGNAETFTVNLYVAQD